MSFFHCEIENGIIRVIFNYPSSITLLAGTDFETGDVTIPGSPPDNPWGLTPGSTLGSDLTTAVIATGAVWIMTSTTGMSANNKVGIELDSGHWFWTRITTIDSGVQITVDRGSPGAAAIGNRCAVVSQLSGSTDFTIVEDFKTPKIENVRNKSERLSWRGVSHEGTIFGIIQKQTGRDLMAMSAFIQTNADNAGDAKPSFDFPNKDGEWIDIPDATSFNQLQNKMGDRHKEIYQDAGGEKDLIYDVIDADNTLTAMDAISDSRT